MNHPHRPPHRPSTGRDAGFTLIELLVVMIIIGVLAAIAVPVFLHQRATARDTAVKSDLRTIATSVRTVGLESSRYPTATELDAAGVVLRTSPTVRASVVWATATDFCLVGTSSAGGADPSRTGQPLNISTKVYAVSASRGPVVLSSADPGCLAGPGSPVATNGYWDETGYRAGAIPRA